jgi:hypothetical protein
MSPVVQASSSSQAVPSASTSQSPVAALQVWHCGHGMAAEHGAAWQVAPLQ